MPTSTGGRLQGGLAFAGALGMLARPVAAVVVGRPGHNGHLPAVPVPPVPIGPSPTGRLPLPGHAADVTPLVAALAALAAIAAMALWRRWRCRTSFPRHTPGTETSTLAAIVAAGRMALDSSAGAREAIIACHAAMNSVLAAAPPGEPAASPEELLRRATGNGMIRASLAGRLTSLFREARFSTHDLAEAQRQAARAALDEISANLSRRL